MGQAPARLTGKMRKLEVKHGQPIQQLLEGLYWDQGLSLAGMSKKLRVPMSTLANWMIRFGINQRAMAERARANELSA